MLLLFLQFPIGFREHERGIQRLPWLRKGRGWGEAVKLPRQLLDQAQGCPLGEELGKGAWPTGSIVASLSEGPQCP